MKKTIKIIGIIFFILIISLLIFGVKFLSDLKLDASEIIDYNPRLTTQIYDRNGELIANLFHKEHRVYATYDEIPPRLIEALIAIEDTTFFEHKGVNYEAIFRAIIKDIKAMKLVEGASTLTQQLVKNTILTNEKKFKRKINEALLAIKVEKELSKEQILERYLNQVYFGHRYYGIKTAAQGYFHKRLHELNLKEMALLVGLPKAPSAFDPTRHYDLALSRANIVLYRMHTLGWITKEELEKYTAFRPTVYDDSLTKNVAPYVVDAVVRELKDEFEDIKRGGYRVYTTIDLNLQKLARESLKRRYDEIIKQHKNEDVNYSDLNGAMVVLENRSGEVLALVGGVDYKKSAFNRATQSLRQPGSSFKPFVYQIALNYGYSTQSKLTDISRTYNFKESEDDNNETNETKEWQPKNYEKNFEGLITLRDALVRSRNLATINLVTSLGLSQVYKEIKKMGFKNVQRDLSISLGTFGISPLEFSGYYTIFSNYGVKKEPILVKKVVDKLSNETIFTSKEQNITTPQQAYLMISILKDVVKRGTGRRANVKGIEIAGKTGTTNNYVDAWFCAFSPEIETIVWFGKDNNKPMSKNETGGKSAAVVVKYFFEEYIKMHPETKREFDIPKGVTKVKIDGRDEFFTDISKRPKETNLIPASSEDGKLLF